MCSFNPVRLIAVSVHLEHALKIDPASFLAGYTESLLRVEDRHVYGFNMPISRSRSLVDSQEML